MEIPTLQRIPRFVWIIPAVLLAVAITRLPYGYYTLTRIVTCAAAVLITVAAHSLRPAGAAWAALFVLLAILFNPFILIHLDRAIWFYLDLGAAGVFAAHLFLVRQKLT